MESIKKLMDAQHRGLVNLLEDFLKNFKNDPIKSGAILAKFRLYVEKHFSIEELAIFNIEELMDSERVEDTFELVEEHQEIMALLNKIQNELGIEVKEDVLKLERLLKEHQKFEDERFYPELEEDLNENQRAEIIKKINEKI